MSAFTVNAAHIDAIVNAARQFGSPDEIDQRTANLLGGMLWDENYRSVNYRYQESEPTPDYTATLIEDELSPVAVLKAMDCYEYQACESPDWQDTRAHAFITAVRGVILGRFVDLARQVPQRHDRTRTTEAYHYLPEYDTAPWEVDSLEQITVARHAGAVLTAIEEEAHRGEGAVYRGQGHLNITEIAKRMRVNLRNAQSVGMLPAGAKFSVTTDRFSMGQSIDVTVKGMPDSWTYGEPVEGRLGRPYSDAATAMMKAIEGMLGEYNRDRSDAMTDYFDVWFYSHVTIEDERSAKFWAEEKARKAQRAAARQARRQG
jgi:hypothetical protein